MMKILFLFSLLILSVKSLKTGYPVNMAFLLMFSCVLISLVSLKMSFTWIFYLLILMFLGGVMILITYMTSIAANEKIFYNSPSPFILSPLLAACFILDEQKAAGQSSSLGLVAPLLELSALTSMIFCFSFLLLGLISVVKLIKLESGPLVKRLLGPNLNKIYICQV